MYQITVEGDKATLVLSGDVDLQTTADLKNEISELSGITALDITAASVGYIDSSGVAVLLMTRQHCMASNIELTMSVISEPVFRVLQIAKLDQLLPVGQVVQTEGGGLDNYGFQALDVAMDDPLGGDDGADAGGDAGADDGEAGESGDIKPGTFG